MTDEVVEERRVQDRGGVELLTGDGGSHNCEDSRADHRADAESGQRNWAEGFLQSAFGVFRIGDQLIDGLAAEELVIQRNAPRLKCFAPGRRARTRHLMTCSMLNGAQDVACAPR